MHSGTTKLHLLPLLGPVFGTNFSTQVQVPITWAKISAMIGTDGDSGGGGRPLEERTQEVAEAVFLLPGPPIRPCRTAMNNGGFRGLPGGRRAEAMSRAGPGARGRLLHPLLRSNLGYRDRKEAAREVPPHFRVAAVPLTQCADCSPMGKSLHTKWTSICKRSSNFASLLVSP